MWSFLFMPATPAGAARAAAIRQLSGVLACSDARANQLLELSNNDVQQAVVLHHELEDFDVGPIDHQRAAGGQEAPQAEPQPRPAEQEQEGRAAALKKHGRSPTALRKRRQKRKALVGMAAAADAQLRARLAHTEKMLKLARKHAERAQRIGFARGGQAERAASKQRRRPGSKKERKAAASAMRRKAAQRKRRAA